MESIFYIEDYLNSLSRAEREMVLSIYNIYSSKTEMKIPGSFEEKILKYLLGTNKNNLLHKDIVDALNKIKSQKILTIINNWTYESAFYNYLRAFRPGVNIRDNEKLQNWVKENIESSRGNCDFCEPEKYTPEDNFGRLYGKHCITAANLARFDKYHSLLIFKKHNPLDFSEEELSDYIDTALNWFQKVRGVSSEYRYSLLLWNCLPRAGASQIHGHMQILAAKEIYPKMKLIIDAAERFRYEFKIEYFDALYKVHDILGLLIEKDNIKILSYLTPIKENEVFIISDSINDTFKGIIYKILRGYIDKLKILSFNFSLYEIPYDKNGNKYFLRIVDRGNILSKTSDIASMELYASPVISQDPVKLKYFLTDL